MSQRVSALCAAAFLFAACSKEPSQADLHRQKGAELFKAGDFAKSAAEYEESLKLNPNQELAIWEKAAFTFMKAGIHDKAAEFLLKTLELKKDAAGKAETYRNIAGMYLQSANRPDKAEEYFNEAVRVDPKDEQSLSWLAEISSQRGGARGTNAGAVPEHLDRALERYDALLALNPGSSAAIVNKRIVLMKYLEHLGRQLQGTNGESVSAELATAARAKLDELRPKLEEVTKRLVDLQKAQKAK